MSNTHLKIIIVGGLSAGPAAAAKARRTNEHAEITLFEAGAHVSYATCGMPYAVSGIIEKESQLMVVKPELLQDRFRIQVKLDEPILRVDSQQQTVYSQHGEYSYDKLIWATGASSTLPPIQGIEDLKERSYLRTLTDFQKISNSVQFKNAHQVVVLGGGLIGVELAENLVHLGKEVTLIEGQNQILPQWSSEFAQLGARTLRQKGVHLITNQLVSRVKKNKDSHLQSIILSDKSEVPCEYLLLCTGMKPNSELLQIEGAETLPNGALIVNQHQETSIPNIYAAGDVASTWNKILNKNDYLPLGTHSNKAGRTAGANAASDQAPQSQLKYTGGYGTAIVKIFDDTLARTGASPSQLKEAKIPARTTTIHANSTPGYYPNPENLTLEITYHPKTLVLLGAQAFGKVGVDKRIDVLSTAIYAGLTIDDLHDLDLAYAPPFSPAKDPVVVAGFVAQNQTQGGCSPYTVNELSQMLNKADPNTYQLIDLRNPKEIGVEGMIPGAKNIPLDHLRRRLNEVNPRKRILCYCAKGMRGYIGVRILREHGFIDSNNLAGGFLSWKNSGKTISHEVNFT